MSKNSIPQIRFQGFDSWWETIKLTDLGISVGGTAIESEFDLDGKYKVISIGSYSEEGKYKDQGIRVKYSKKTERRILEKDDLTMILNDKTSTGKIIGRVLLIDEDNSYVYNQRTQRICLDKNKYVPDFIFQLLNADINRNKIVRSAQGNTQIYVNWSDISNLDYLIPDSFDEQSAIGILFRTLDDLLSSYKDNLANYQSLKTTMLSKMFPKAGQTVPEIRLDGFESEWELYELKSRAETITKGTTPKDKSWQGEVNYIKTESINRDTGSLVRTASTSLEEHLGYLKRSILKEGDVLFSIVGTLGVVGIVDKKDLPANTNQQIAIIRLKSDDAIFMLNFLKSPRIKSFIKSDSTIGAQPSLSLWQIEKIKVSLPPSLEEQQAIGAYFSNLDNLINSHQEKISQLETLKKKLLQDMFI
ncbi:restriction endonuclease subunit S [Streptococcus oralis]|uniref:restriction endonuclease subunit S n=1 Tax=Streptococcus oralis TaxID=1303 RepID=UPI000BBD0C27|nr:restriction endonuclease subunit S [Streptococcus oralis]ATF57210.1 restriction endonuclease subunit S [Streptococcus oralis]